MLTLGLETATNACAAALWCGRTQRLLAQRSERMERGQAERLVPLLDQMLVEAGIGWAALDRLAVTIGPGTFTGLRIGLAAARGLSLALDRPLVGVTTLEAAALAGLEVDAPQGAVRLAAIDSRRDAVFIQAFDAAGLPLTPPADILPQDLVRWAVDAVPGFPLVIIGDAAARAAEALGRWGHPVTVAADAAALMAIALAKLATRLTAAEMRARPADPFYLRPPDVTLPKREGA